MNAVQVQHGNVNKTWIITSDRQMRTRIYTASTCARQDRNARNANACSQVHAAARVRIAQITSSSIYSTYEQIKLSCLCAFYFSLN